MYGDLYSKYVRSQIRISKKLSLKLINQINYLSLSLYIDVQEVEVVREKLEKCCHKKSHKKCCLSSFSTCFYMVCFIAIIHSQQHGALSDLSFGFVSALMSNIPPLFSTRAPFLLSHNTSGGLMAYIRRDTYLVLKQLLLSPQRSRIRIQITHLGKLF